MNTDQIINNLRHAKPKIYTMAVAQAMRSAEAKLGWYEGGDGLPKLSRADVQALVEAIVEGVVYNFVPLLAATLAEMQAAGTEVAPPLEDNARNPDGTPYHGTPGGPSSDAKPNGPTSGPRGER